MRRAAWLASTVVVVLATGALPSVAAPLAVPVVGECYDLTDDQVAEGGYWSGAAAVPCTEPHTFEVTETGPVPMDVNAFDFATDRCGHLDVWTALRINGSKAGIIDDPLRVEARSFTSRPAPTTYVCGAVVAQYNGRNPVTVVSIATPLDRLRPRARASLRHCSSAADDRPATAAPVTVDCTDRPRWQVRSWVLWSVLYDDFPGRTELRRHARELCGDVDEFSVPTAREWRSGLPRTWCYDLYP